MIINVRQQKIVAFLKELGPATRYQIAEALDMLPNTCQDNLLILIERKEIERKQIITGKGGRRSFLYYVKEEEK
jgi:predicted ArsR family transcriptional regulator